MTGNLTHRRYDRVRQAKKNKKMAKEMETVKIYVRYRSITKNEGISEWQYR